MGWFAIALEPLLIFLEKGQTDIQVGSLPTFDPSLMDGTPPSPVEEQYKVYGFADDIPIGE